MSVIYPPPGTTGPVVVSDEGHHANHDNHHNYDTEVILREQLASARDADSRLTEIVNQGSQVEGRSLVESAKNAAAQILEIAKNTAALSTQAAMLSAEQRLAHQAQNNALTLQISNGFAEGAAKLAECCCEIKSTIRDQADKVIDRVDEIEDLRKAVELADAKAEIALLKSNADK